MRASPADRAGWPVHRGSPFGSAGRRIHDSMPKTTTRPRPRAQMAEYQAERRSRSLTLYFPSREEMDRFHSIAHANGYGRNFSGWGLLMLHHATSGHLYPPEYVDDLKREGERLREWLEKARDEAEDYRPQIKILQGKVNTALVLFAGLEEGAQLAKQLDAE